MISMPVLNTDFSVLAFCFMCICIGIGAGGRERVPSPQVIKQCYIFQDVYFTSKYVYIPFPIPHKIIPTSMTLNYVHI